MGWKFGAVVGKGPTTSSGVLLVLVPVSYSGGPLLEGDMCLQSFLASLEEMDMIVGI